MTRDRHGKSRHQQRQGHSPPGPGPEQPVDQAGPGEEPAPPAAQPPAQVQEQPGAPSPPAEPTQQMPDVAALAAQCDDLLARLQRVSADYLNYQKRAGREVAEARQFANSALVKDLLPVLDDLERAVAAAQSHQAQAATDHPQAAALEAVLTGVRLVHEKLMSVLAGYGLKRIEADGQPFDPVLHQALVQEPSRRHASPTVLRMLVPGYEMKGRVLRPAGVVVSTGAGPGQPELPPAGPEEGEARQTGDRPQEETD